MKSIKLAMILLVGQCVFNPFAALSKPLFTDANLVSVYKNGNEYSCYAVERAGNYFEDGLGKLCDHAGYERMTDYTEQSIAIAETNNHTIVEGLNGVDYNCARAESEGYYFRHLISEKCEEVGYVRNFSYPPNQQDIDALRVYQIDSNNKFRAWCLILSELGGTTEPDVARECTAIGIPLNLLNLR